MQDARKTGSKIFKNLLRYQCNCQHQQTITRYFWVIRTKLKLQLCNHHVKKVNSKLDYCLNGPKTIGKLCKRVNRMKKQLALNIFQRHINLIILPTVIVDKLEYLNEQATLINNKATENWKVPSTTSERKLFSVPYMTSYLKPYQTEYKIEIK